MASQLNKVFIVGRLTRDPDFRTTTSGASVADFGLANTRTWKSKDGETHQETCFIDITAWGTLAELVQKYLTKGVMVLVEGGLRLDQWTSKDGDKRSKVRLNLDSFQRMEFDRDKFDKRADEGENEDDENPPY
jgi:single-strand DNA-binding protein